MCEIERKEKGLTTGLIPMDGSLEGMKTFQTDYISAIKSWQSVLENALVNGEKWHSAANEKVMDAIAQVENEFDELIEEIKTKKENTLKHLKDFSSDLEKKKGEIENSKKASIKIDNILQYLNKTLIPGKYEGVIKDEEDKIIQIIKEGYSFIRDSRKWQNYKYCGSTEEFKTSIECFRKELKLIQEVILEIELSYTPNGPYVKESSSTSVQLQWNKDRRLTEYTILAKKRNGDEKEKKQEWGHEIEKTIYASSNGNSLIINDLASGRKYDFRIKGKDENGMSTKWSEAVSVELKANGPTSDIRKAIFNVKKELSNENGCIGALVKLSELFPLDKPDKGKRIKERTLLMATTYLLFIYLFIFIGTICILTLKNLKCLLNFTDKKGKEIVGAGGVETILNAIKAYAEISCACQFGCYALSNVGTVNCKLHIHLKIFSLANNRE